MDKKQKSQSARKPGIFGSLSGFFCQCGEEDRSMTNEKEYQMKSRALSSDISTSTASELYREIEEELLVKRDPYEYKPCLVTKPNYWHPVSEFEISHEQKNVNLYSWGRYHAFLGQGKYIGQRPVGLLEPQINLKSEEPIKVSLRFNKFSKVSGFCLCYKSIAESIQHNLGCVTKRKNQWIQENMLNPESEQNNGNSQKSNNVSLSYGGIYIIHEQGSDKSTMICSDRFDQVPITWKEKDHIILEYCPKKNTLKIQVVNYLTFETKSYSFQIDLESILRHEEREQEEPLHFGFVLDQLQDSVEILGEPEANHIKQKTPPQIKDIHFYDLSQKYYVDQSCCSTRIKFENKSMDCVLISSDNYYLQNVHDDDENSYMFAYLKPCIPFPNEKIYIKRIAFMIESLGEGELFLGITREAYAIHNADIDTPKPEEEWLGRRMMFRSSGKGLMPNQSQVQKFNSSFTSGQLVIIEYNPFTDSVTMINQNNTRSVINNVYADFTDKEFKDKQNRYCFCVGGSSNFRICLYNDYFDDIEDSLRQ